MDEKKRFISEAARQTPLFSTAHRTTRGDVHDMVALILLAELEREARLEADLLDLKPELANLTLDAAVSLLDVDNLALRLRAALAEFARHASERALRLALVADAALLALFAAFTLALVEGLAERLRLRLPRLHARVDIGDRLDGRVLGQMLDAVDSGLGRAGC